MGEVIRFPVKEPSCADCTWGAFSHYGVHCTFFHEDIWQEKAVAAECEEFQTIDMPRRAEQ